MLQLEKVCLQEITTGSRMAGGFRNDVGRHKIGGKLGRKYVDGSIVTRGEVGLHFKT